MNMSKEEKSNEMKHRTIHCNLDGTGAYVSTKEERMSVFMGCWQMATCEGDLTAKDKEQLARVMHHIDLSEEELTQFMDQPETVAFVVPDNKAGCQHSVKCLISIALENGKINSAKQGMMLHAACASYGISDDECSALIDQLAQEEAQNQIA